MSNPVLRTASRLARWPLTTLIRPHPWLNARVWDVQYALGLWSYLDRTGSDGPVELIGKYVHRPRVLDLGCGTTVNLRLAAGRYRHYHGVDISRAAIRRARALCRPDTSFEVADVLDYRPTTTYDAILLREILYYLPVDDAVALLRRLTGALTPAGVIVVTSYDAASPVVARIRDCGLAVVEEVARPDGVTLVLRGGPDR